ncbi:MAG: DUF1802 family protein [Akkermansiaceae bacterium]
MIAFKEWEVICEALESGRQSIILRKGGIHEGREGFSFAHDEFLLFPTRFHAQGEYVTVPNVVAKPEWSIGDEVVIASRVRVNKAVTLTDWEEVAKLSDQHIWTEETIRDRFFWEGKGMASGSIPMWRWRNSMSLSATPTKKSTGDVGVGLRFEDLAVNIEAGFL